MEIEISGSSSPASCEVLDIDGNYARNDCDSRRKSEFKDDDDFFNMNVPIEKEGEQDVLYNSLDATCDINLVHSQIFNDIIPKLDIKFKTEEAAYEFYYDYTYEVGFSVRRSKEHKDKRGRLVNRIFRCSCEAAKLSGAFARFKDFLTDFSECIFNYENEDDFISAWNAMLERLVDDRRYEELKAHYRAIQSSPSLSFLVEILKHATSIYTHDVFVLFQRELSKAHNCNLNRLGESGRVTEYDISPFGKD
ncbi:hypothetical protein RHSIM_Rhsim01G0129000 [Rhododendron simsii]|uniref:Protein FAR1-RELATED SEQUENCE n=1 Tax=Rhododendron simsii TaxID=118357 RepID=A0A834LUK1_RHOSS|nr:hypothetical protein RHSIM_Rhsim01G0129000 [Rhododendron simsii]